MNECPVSPPPLSAGAAAAAAAPYPWLAEVRERYRAVAHEPLPRNVPALLAEAATAVPDAVALHFIESGSDLTYAALLANVRRLAGGLSRLGIGHGSHVGVMLPNVAEMPTTWLALATLGAVMVPINVRYTAHELAYVLANSNTSHLVIHQDFLPLLSAMPPKERPRHLICVGDRALDGAQSWHDLLDASPLLATPSGEPQIDDLLNIQYTSGTTGFPKGCLLTHRYWLTCAKAYAACDGLRYRRILAANPFFYMTPQWLMLMAFYQRATLFVAPYLSLTQYVDWIRRYGIEFCWFPTDIVAQTAPRPDDAGLGMIRGNLAIHRADLHAELEHRFGFPARAAFGMTEIGTGLIMPIEAAEFVGSGSCGLAGPFREVRIADGKGRSLPPGDSGELQIRGPGILKGYYGNPEATAAAFHGDWFRTGDLAVQDKDGFVTIQGRIKEMIRRAGENISATEVEAALLSVPGVAEAAALPVPDVRRGEEVKAYVVLTPGVSPETLPPEQIVDHCRKRLAAFKLPRFIEYRTSPLPRSTSGKVRKPDLVAERADLREGCWDRLAGRAD